MRLRRLLKSGPLRPLALAAMLLAACTRPPAVDKNTLAGPTDDLTIIRDVAYEPGDRHGLDIYALRKAGPPRPVIVYLYGGAWTEGSKAQYLWLGAALARKGFVVAIPDYRVYPRGVWPEFIQDNAAAVRWVKDNVARYGGDPSKIVLIGHSAGAFNAFTLAVDRRWLNAVGLDPAKDLKALIGLSGPYSMWPLDGPNEQEIFGGNKGYSEPSDHIDGKSPPMLLLVGEHDRMAGPEFSPQMADLVRKKGGAAQAILYPNVGHGDTVDALGGLDGPAGATMRKDIDLFLADHGVVPSP